VWNDKEGNAKSAFLDYQYKADMDLTVVIWKNFSQSQDEPLGWKKIRKDIKVDGQLFVETIMFEESKSGKYLTTKTVNETKITVIVGMINKTPLIRPN
jgi:hypothetical protein